METKKELKILLWIIIVFAIVFFLPVGNERFLNAITASLDLLKWYAREHIVLCLLPAFLIAGVIAVFISQASVIRYFGANAKKWVAYSVASISGAILAVCSCTILPLFTSIYKRGAGIGPAITFLYSGPAINILAIILTARILGVEIGVARTIGAIVFSIAIGLIMAFIYRHEEENRKEEQTNLITAMNQKTISETAALLFSLVFVLIFANFGMPSNKDISNIWFILWLYKWYITGFFALLFAFLLIKILKISWRKVLIITLLTAISAIVSHIYIQPSLAPLLPMLVGIALLSLIILQDKSNYENKEWIYSSWDFTKQILPLLAIGILISGFLLGSTHDDVNISGVVPKEWILTLVGDNSFFSNLFASVFGAFMYFATLTEVPILQGLMASGMGKGPALALLLSGPSLSLPNILVIRQVLGTKKTLIYVCLVIVLSSISGMIFGLL
ncbi:MAG: permease [Bacteroidales bacterium]|nr:permease [Bacteroidales bacterium]